MPRSKVSAFFSVLLVFASGCAVGALSYRLYTVKTVVSGGTVPKVKRSPDEMRKAVVADLKNTLKLDDQQVSEIQKVYVEMGESFFREHKQYKTQADELHDKWEHETNVMHDTQVAKIKSILRPDQEPVYDKWLSEKAAQRKRWQLEHSKDGKGPGRNGNHP